MRKIFKNGISLLAIVMFAAVLAVTAIADYEIVTMNKAISYTGAALNDPIDGMWCGGRGADDLKSYQEGITGDGTFLNLKGFSYGDNAQYAYVDQDEFHNKLIKIKLKFDGEMVNPSSSFIAFAFRSTGYSAKMFWNYDCYSILIKGGQIEAQKLPARKNGVNNNLGGSKGNTPIVVPLETPFTAGTYDIEVGALDGISPATNKEAVNLILRINGKEVLNVWDDSGRTPIIKNKGYFIIALCNTNADMGDNESHSSVTIYKTEAGSAQSNKNEQSVKDNTPSETTKQAEPQATVKTSAPTKATAPEETQPTAAEQTQEIAETTSQDEEPTVSLEKSDQTVEAISGEDATESTVNPEDTEAPAANSVEEDGQGSKGASWVLYVIIAAIIIILAIVLYKFFVAKKKSAKE